MRADDLDEATFERMPLVAMGESKEVRDMGGGLVAIRFRPTVYSHTHNRCALIEGTDLLRLRASRVLVEVVRRAGVAHAYTDVGSRFVIARRVMDPPPIEVIVKAFHVGTPKHRYRGTADFPVRASHPRHAGRLIAVGEPYPEPWVRFDWRNPLRDEAGAMVSDEPLAEPLADLWIDVARARETARVAFDALASFLGVRGVILLDVCFFLASDGATMFGELSPDCGRFRSASGPLDKDVFRAGGSSERVLDAWRGLVDRVECHEAPPPRRSRRRGA